MLFIRWFGCCNIDSVWFVGLVCGFGILVLGVVAVTVGAVGVISGILLFRFWFVILWLPIGHAMFAWVCSDWFVMSWLL